MKKTPEVVADPPAAPPTLECDPQAIKQLVSAMELLTLAEAELQRCARAQQHLLREIAGLTAQTREAKNSRFRELIALYADAPQPKYPEDTGSGDRLRLNIADGVLHHLVQYHIPEAQRMATRCQVACLRAQAAVARSVGEFRKIRLHDMLEPAAAFEGELEIGAASLRTTKVLALADNLEAAAYKLERRNEEFQRAADQGQPRAGAFEPHMPLSAEFNSLFFVEAR
jgi:hypothetical protein